jgi:iron complex transport system substrate-binding protein
MRARLVMTVVAVVTLLTPAWASRMLRDDAGRNISVPDQVHRVVCLSPSITQTAYAIGADGEIVGITDYTEYPPEAKRQKPSVGELLHPSLERIASLRPDLAIGLATMNSVDTIRAIERMGVPVFLLSPHSIAGIYQDVLLMGRLLGREGQASALVKQLKAREQAVRVRARTAYQPSVFLVLGMEPVITAGRNAFIIEMIEAAGARSITSDVSQDWTRYNLETVIQRQPDYLLVVQGSPFGLQEMQRNPAWNSLAAVRLGHVITIDKRIQVPAPIAFDGLENFFGQLHAQYQAAGKQPAR